jgi:hypothetical protein
MPGRKVADKIDQAIHPALTASTLLVKPIIFSARLSMFP